jgi:hypothetical protein
MARGGDAAQATAYSIFDEPCSDLLDRLEVINQERARTEIERLVLASSEGSSPASTRGDDLEAAQLRPTQAFNVNTPTAGANCWDVSLK